MRYSWEAKKWICDKCQLSRDAPAQSSVVTSTSFADQKMLLAASIVGNPALVDQIRGSYQTIVDQTLGVKSLAFDNLDRAIKIMGEKGWRPVSIATNNIVGAGFIAYRIYALLERTH